MKRALAMLSAVFLFATACGQSSTCVVGASSACSCTDGRMGAQSCQVGGTFSECVCSGGSGGGSSGTGGGSAVSGKRIFVTSATFTGDLGGVAGADGKCSSAAAGANLTGTWKAWISNGTVDAIDRIADVGPWYLLSGTLAFNNKANLSSTPLHAINVTEQGSVLSSGYAWTGTLSGGHRATDSNGPIDCSAWAAGDLYESGAHGALVSTTLWTNDTSTGNACSNMDHLYCLEQ